MTQPDPRRRSLVLLLVSMVGMFVVLRAMLAVSPNSDFNAFGYNIHHLFTGILIVTASAVPLALDLPRGRMRDVFVAGLGLGLGLVLDEWVYLIATDGSNASYLLPVSLWGGVVVIGVTVVYTFICYAAGRRAVER